MAGQGTIPEFGFGTNSNAALTFSAPRSISKDSHLSICSFKRRLSSAISMFLAWRSLSLRDNCTFASDNSTSFSPCASSTFDVNSATFASRSTIFCRAA
ncbi:hypothetical protein HanRHA438_Chr06g0263171 [Helianthus annuus]|nr:hypothetical protein HanRHA438_Chr06g0263171 [Helianthus annuus]